MAHRNSGSWTEADIMPNESLFLDSLTKEEKEALLSKKMEEIRRKNEYLLKRHKEVEADKQKAEQLNRSITTDTSSQSPSGPGPGLKGMRGVDGGDQSDDRKSKLARGRGRRLANTAAEVNKKKPSGKPEQRSEQRTEQHYEARSEKRLGQRSEQHYEARSEKQVGQRSEQHYEARPKKQRSEKHFDARSEKQFEPRSEPQYDARSEKQFEQQRAEPKSPDENAPPPDPSYNFLADRAREGPVKDRSEPNQQSQGRRHPRNFGGDNFSAVKNRIRTEKEKQAYEGPPKSPLDLQMKMSGKERREYVAWKEERDRVDQERMDRQKKNTGEWRREWDVEKDTNKLAFDEPPPQPPVSRRMEPALRPAGRIGSGRFVRGETDERLHGDTTPTRAVAGRGGPKRGGGRGRGRGGPANESAPNRRRVSSSGSDEARMVEEQNDTITIKIENEFAGKGPASPIDDQGGPGRQFPRGRGMAHERGGREFSGPRGGRGTGRGGDRGSGRGGDRGSGRGGVRGSGRGGDRGSGRGGDRGLRGRGGRGSDRGRGVVKRGSTSPRYVGSGRIPQKDNDYSSEDFNPDDYQEQKETEKTWERATADVEAEVWQVDSPKREISPAQPDTKPSTAVEASQSQSQEEEYHDAEDAEEENDDDELPERRSDNEEDEYYDDEEYEGDHHNSSAESLERFIREHTLKVDNEGNVQKVTHQTTRVSTPTLKIPQANGEQGRPDSQQQMLSPVTPTSPQSPLAEIKTPVGHVKVLDWGIEMDNQSFSDTSNSHSSTDNSPAKVANLSISDDSYQSPDKSDKNSSPTGSGQKESAPATIDPETDAPQTKQECQDQAASQAEVPGDEETTKCSQQDNFQGVSVDPSKNADNLVSDAAIDPTPSQPVEAAKSAEDKTLSEETQPKESVFSASAAEDASNNAEENSPKNNEASNETGNNAAVIGPDAAPAGTSELLSSEQEDSSKAAATDSVVTNMACSVEQAPDVASPSVEEPQADGSSTNAAVASDQAGSSASGPDAEVAGTEAATPDSAQSAGTDSVNVQPVSVDAAGSGVEDGGEVPDDGGSSSPAEEGHSSSQPETAADASAQQDDN